MKIRLNIDSVSFQRKPTGAEPGAIQNRLVNPQEIELADLFREICRGVTFRPAATNGKSDFDFVSQQVFCVDIDNSHGKKPVSEPERLTPAQAIDKATAAGLKVTFCYPTFSDSDALRKCRLLFVLDEPVTDRKLQERIANHIVDIFGRAADGACTNPGRLFYGTNKSPILTDTNAINSLKEIVAGLPDKTISKPRKKAEIRKGGTLYNIPLQRTSRTSNIELIRAGNVKELRKRLGSKKPKIFDNSEAFLKYVYSELDIAKLLEISRPKKFHCIFHDDEEESGSIFTDFHGNQRYVCHARKRNKDDDGKCIAARGIGLNIKQIFEILMDARSEYRTFEFIKQIYNLEVKETEWSAEQKANIDAIIQCMTSTGGNGFSDICPTAAKTTKYATLIFLQILNIARNNIYPQRQEDADENVIFSVSVRQLAKACGKSSIGKVNNYLKMLIYHRMLEIVPDEEIPKKMLDAANAYTRRKGEENHRRINFYRIPSWVIERTQLIDTQGERWKRYNYRLNAISYEVFFRGDEEEKKMAKILYPQTATYTTKTGETVERTTTKKSNENTGILTKILLEQIEEHGYSTEAKVIEQARRQIGRMVAEVQIKKSVNQIMEKHNLQKIRAKKAVKESFGIESDGYPFIIIPGK